METNDFNLILEVMFRTMFMGMINVITNSTDLKNYINYIMIIKVIMISMVIEIPIIRLIIIIN